MTPHEAIKQAAQLIGPGEWSPGCWTAARCDLYQNLSGEHKAKLYDWVEKEKTNGRCWNNQLPKLQHAAE